MELIGCTLGVVDHRAVSGPGSRTWLVGAPEGWEARPTKLPEAHLLAMPENLLSPQPNLKKRKYLYANLKKGIIAGAYKISYRGKCCYIARNIKPLGDLMEEDKPVNISGGSISAADLLTASVVITKANVCMYLMLGKGQIAQKRPYCGENRLKNKIYG